MIDEEKGTQLAGDAKEVEQTDSPIEGWIKLEGTTDETAASPGGAPYPDSKVRKEKLPS